MNDASQDQQNGTRIAKYLARAGLGSRREIEKLLFEGHITINNEVILDPATKVTNKDLITFKGEVVKEAERTRMWLYHKPRGLVTTNSDERGRETVFDYLPHDLPRVMSVGRLDINTEGLLLLTNDGGLARVLELPKTGWLRKYRVRAFGRVYDEDLEALARGVTIDGEQFGSIEATVEKEIGDNVWLMMGLREGKNREIKRVLEVMGLSVNRLIRVSFGPFQLADLKEGEVREIRTRFLRDQLGEALIEEAGADFDAPLYVNSPVKVKPQSLEKIIDPEKKRRRTIADTKGRKVIIEHVKSDGSTAKKRKFKKGHNIPLEKQLGAKKPRAPRPPQDKPGRFRK